ncbi:MAG: hypothetical protein ACFFE5_07490 [Candidatus Thorarchaeota archaeon]
MGGNCVKLVSSSVNISSLVFTSIKGDFNSIGVVRSGFKELGEDSEASF